MGKREGDGNCTSQTGTVTEVSLLLSTIINVFSMIFFYDFSDLF